MANELDVDVEDVLRATIARYAKRNRAEAFKSHFK